MIENNYYINNELDMSGSILKTPFVDYVKRIILDRGDIFYSGMEWCSGVGEIGLELLRENLCREFIFADIRQEPIEISKNIANRDGLLDRASFFISDNFNDIPISLKFDLIVGNPPTYCNIQEDHPIGGGFRGDPRASDINWDVHRKFYKQAAKFLNSNGVILSHEIEPFKREIFIHSKTPYDLRSELPIVEFNKMINDGGLVMTGCAMLTSMHDGVKSYIVESRKI